MFYRDLATEIAKAKSTIFFIDGFLDEDVFNLYVSKVPIKVLTRVLSSRIGTNVEAVAKKFANGRSLELRAQHNHDRHFH